MIEQLTGTLGGMFAGEKRLAIAILAIVAASGCLVEFAGANGLGGALLLGGCLGLLVASARRDARAGARRGAR